MTPSLNLLPMTSVGSRVDNHLPTALSFVPSGLMGQDLIILSDAKSLTVSSYISQTMGIAMRPTDTVFISGVVETLTDQWDDDDSQPYPWDRLVYSMPIANINNAKQGTTILPSRPLLIGDMFTEYNSARTAKPGERVVLISPIWSAAPSLVLENVDLSLVPSLNAGRAPLTVNLGKIQLDPTYVGLNRSQLVGASQIQKPVPKYTAVASDLRSTMSAIIAKLEPDSLEPNEQVPVIFKKDPITGDYSAFVGDDMVPTGGPVKPASIAGVNLWLTSPQNQGAIIPHNGYPGTGYAIMPMDLAEAGNWKTATDAGQGMILLRGGDGSAEEITIKIDSQMIIDYVEPVLHSTTATNAQLTVVLVADPSTMQDRVKTAPLYLTTQGYFSLVPSYDVIATGTNIPPALNSTAAQMILLLNPSHQDVESAKTKNGQSAVFYTSPNGDPTPLYPSAQDSSKPGGSEIAWIKSGGPFTLSPVSAYGSVSAAYQTARAERPIKSHQYPLTSADSTSLSFRLGGLMIRLHFPG